MRSCLAPGGFTGHDDRISPNRPENAKAQNLKPPDKSRPGRLDVMKARWMRFPGLMGILARSAGRNEIGWEELASVVQLGWALGILLGWALGILLGWPLGILLGWPLGILLRWALGILLRGRRAGVEAEDFD
jgi:hypothetical protein